MWKSTWLSLLLFLLVSYFVFSQEKSELQTVPSVDLKRYAGTWYEIARLRKPWELACALNNVSTYTYQESDRLHVTSQCQSTKFFHRLEKAEGTLEVVDKKTSAKLKISYSNLFSYKWLYNGDYWIVQLAEDYSYVVVSEPTQQHLWILSRTPTLSSDLYTDILAKITLQFPNINILDVIRTDQDPKKTQTD